MVFKSKEDLGGKIDPNINAAGRPSGDSLLKVKNKNDIGQDELHKILRKIRPLTKKALAKFNVILDEESDASETGQIRVAIYILDKYKDLIEDLYIDIEDSSETPTESLEAAPVFSLTMAGDKKNK